MHRVLNMLIISGVLLAAAGCGGGDKAVEGNVKIDSTSVFKKNKAVQSPPPKTPPQ